MATSTVIPIIVVTTPSGTEVYDLNRLPPIVCGSIREMRGERCWMEVVAGDVVSDAKRYMERVETMNKAIVKGVDLRDIPSKYRVQAVLTYDSLTPTSRPVLQRGSSKDQKVVRIYLDSGDDKTPRVEYYLLDRLPQVVRKRIEEGGGYRVSKSPTLATQDSSPASQSGYSSVFFDDIRPSDLEDPEQVKAWNLAAAERTVQLDEARVRDVSVGYNVVFERVYSV